MIVGAVALVATGIGAAAGAGIFGAAAQAAAAAGTGVFGTIATVGAIASLGAAGLSAAAALSACKPPGRVATFSPFLECSP